MFKQSFSFEGRIRRTEFCLSFLAYNVITLFVSSSIQEREIHPIMAILILIPTGWFLFAQGAKRCHDRDNSGWYQFIPLYGLWMLFANSNYGSNRYGLNPKGL
ncbi:DUF805 domain-containing protein [Dyadobacter flavalbus]|uniref:DUF805 domain-containing protein n=1 Tax=Dyadobacter flavalbus TaxID=2579942 RepID=A0A5M8QTX2_9BACT|nr:DUF805 domain-containing protein [Dyadobacter flavalbus]KAA6438741.1 DUF805 domain-containing protein [Dyadobacter flavalbus]